ncbi:MAG: Large-conductance mechanosensitive channel [Elusimicrobia bacterium]|nr:Large-conductance mechanosensitive channel [Elusimicrobiota bacterium]
MRGNVVDLAVGVIIGGAFGKIITSVVNDIIMPPIGLLLGNVDFSDLKIVLKDATETSKAVSLNYGVFINHVLDFTIVAFCVFLIVKAMNSLKKKEAAAPATPTTKECKQCLSQIPLKAVKCAFCTSAA